MPATSIFIKAASSAISGIGYSRISVLLGPVRTAASTFSTTAKASYNQHDLAGTLGGGIERSSVILRRCDDAAVLQETSRPRCGARPGAGVDARSLQASRRRRDPGR